MNIACTIVTSGYLPLAKVLFASLKKHAQNIQLHVLVVDEVTPKPSDGIAFHSLQELSLSTHFQEIEKKYAHSNPHSFRWALKPVFIGYLLNQGFEKVIFVDADIYFVGNFDFIYSELDKKDVLLTPHWANLDPTENDDSLLSVMKGGMFNAGFIASNKAGINIMSWWAGLCMYKTENNKELGLFYDQKYLDILPVQFENVGILRHRGCNLASWNLDSSRRELVNGKVIINKIFEPVFIHFAKDTISNILNRNDTLLKPYLDEYTNELTKEKFSLPENLDLYDPLKYDSTTYKLKHQLRLRTRVKRFFFKLAEKL